MLSGRIPSYKDDTGAVSMKFPFYCDTSLSDFCERYFDVNCIKLVLFFFRYLLTEIHCYLEEYSTICGLKRSILSENDDVLFALDMELENII